MAETVEERAVRLANELAEANNRLGQMSGHIESYRSPKLPAFFRADPSMWFTQVEASFRHARITVEGTKADHVIANLDQEAMAAIRDIALIEPQPDDIYRRIKERLISSFSSSTESKLRKLLKGQVLNEGKPSLILSRLRNLDEGAKCDDTILKSIFLDQLQPSHRAIIAASGVDDLSQLALLADKIAENTPSDARISALERDASTASLSSEINRLVDAFSKFSTRLDKLESAVKSSKAQARSDNDKGRNRSRSRSRDASGLCLAHKKYPDNPTSCRNWCKEYSKWSSKN